MMNTEAWLEKTPELIVNACDKHDGRDVFILNKKIESLSRERDELQQEADALVVAQYEISACEAQIFRLREALKPFADMANVYGPQKKNDEETVWPISHLPTIGDLRRARNAMDATK